MEMLYIFYSTPNSYKGKRAETICKLVLKEGHGRTSIDNIEKIISLSKESIGTYNHSDALLIKQLSSLISIFEEQKKELIEEMTNIIKEHFPKILSIPGIGGNTAAGIIGEIGDISNFHSSDSLLAFAGLNPLVYESGKFKALHTRISKKGSSYLRNALTLVARSIIKHDETFSKYYLKKRDEGKSYNTAICHVRKKIVRVIYSILKNNNEYKSLNN